MQARFAAGWRQVGATFCLMAAGAMISSAYGVVAVPLAHEFSPSRMVLMLTITVVSLVSGLLSPVVGTLMDRISLRLLLTGGALALAAGFFALSFAHSFTQVLVVYALLMAPANIIIGPLSAAVLLSRWFVRRRGAALGIAISGVAMGTFIYPPIIQALLDQFDWRTAFRLLSLVILALTLPAALLVINRPADRGLHPDGLAADPEVGRGGETIPALTARMLLADPTFWLAGAMFAVVLSGMIGMVTNLVPMARDIGIGPGAAALLVSFYAAGGFCAKLGFAAIADRMNLRHLMFLSLGGFAMGLACLIRPETGYWLIATGVTMIGFFGGFMVPLQGFFIARVYGSRVVGRVAGLLNLFVLAALLATPPLFGRIFDVTGSYALIFAIFTALAAATLLLVPSIRLQPRDEMSPGRGGAVPLPLH